MDFCRDILCPKISSDKPSVDGKEVINLITNQYGANRSEYICESFVGTPVDINIEFPIPIDLACIVLNIEVGSRRSRGVSVLARFETSSVYNSSLSSGASNLPSITKKSSLSRSSSDSLITIQKNIAKKDDNLVCLGKWFTNKESIIVLKNFHYKHALSFSLPSFKNDAKTYTGTLRHPNRCSIVAVKELIIRILSVSPTGSPVLRSMNIWGQPSMNLNSSLKNKYIQLWIKNCVHGSNQIKDKSTPSSLAVESNIELKNTSNSEISLSVDPIPEDFLDSLTCEVMTVPILLPSGNSVDMHTLEKFFANEAIWGRSPSDPFTGIVFKDGFTPEPNVPLKSRIDRFLLLNKNKNVDINHYTVGSSLDYKIGGRGRKRSGDKTEDEGSPTKLQKHKHFRTMSLTNTSTLGHSSTSLASQCSSSKGSKNCTNALPPRASKDTGVSINDTSAKNGHNLVRSLGNVLLFSSKASSRSKPGSLITLKNHSKVTSAKDVTLPLPSPNFVTSGDTSLVKPFSLDSVMQGKISCQCGQKEVLYELLCSHIICRKCLSARPSLPLLAVQCSQCIQISHRHHIKRYHPPSVFER